MAEKDTLNRIAYQGRALPENLDMLLHLGVEHDDMFDNIKMHRVNAVIDYFKSFQDGMGVLRRVALKAPREHRIDTLWEYMHMRKTHELKREEVAAKRNELQTQQLELDALTRDIEGLE